MLTNHSPFRPNSESANLAVLPIPFVTRAENATNIALDRFASSTWDIDIERARTAIAMLGSVLDLRAHDIPQHPNYDTACATMRRATASVAFLESYQRSRTLRQELQRTHDTLINTRVQMSIAREHDDPGAYARLERTIANLRSEIVEIKNRLDTIEHTARHDPLTGVLTRSAILDAIDAEWTQSSTQQLNVGLLFIDVDTFKSINDTFDHATGDTALAIVGTQILRCLKRSGELVGRYGGDEFLVLLPNVTVNDCAAIAELIRISVAATHIPFNEQRIPVTVSIGGSIATPSTDVNGRHGARTLRQRADDALAQAKAGGRNRAVICTNTDPPKMLAISVDGAQQRSARAGDDQRDIQQE